MIYHVRAVRWAQGWELHIDGAGVTQCERLDEADETVRDYLRLDGHTDSGTAEVAIHPNLGEMEVRVAAMRDASVAADAARREASHTAAETTKALRASGLSVADTAYVLGLSRGRVSQLAKQP